jgi:DNA-binding MarR family transcriptional regulator
METQVRKLLRDQHDTTLPRFDVLAALYRAEDSLRMNALSKQLLVSNGNVTGIVERLVSDGLVQRVIVKNDRRSMLVSLTPEGRRIFSRLATDHAALINTLFSKLEGPDLDLLAGVFARLKQKEDEHGQDG